jgi:hypothetical protein
MNGNAASDNLTGNPVQFRFSAHPVSDAVGVPPPGIDVF